MNETSKQHRLNSPLGVRSSRNLRQPPATKLRTISNIAGIGLSLLLTLGLIASCNSNQNGETYSGPNVGRSVTLGGYSSNPGDSISIRVLNNAYANPDVSSNWVEVATTTTSTTPSQWDDNTNLYFWSVDAVLVPSASVSQRWPENGVVKIQTAINQVITSVTFDDTSCMVDAYHAGLPFISALNVCRSHDGGVLTFVDTDDASGNIPTLQLPPLTYKATALGQTDPYYRAIGARTSSGNPSAARGTFTAWKATNGFPNGELHATYYNKGDLGFGRDMHCRVTSYGRACYVTNYGVVDDGLDDFHNGSALADAVAGTNPGATVAMEWHATAAFNDNPVRFFVYDTKSGGTDGLIEKIALDSNPTDQPIPGLCLACHGGTFKPADGTSPTRVEGAQFLPFDVESFGYHSTKPYTSQESDLRSLNFLVQDTLTPGTYNYELINTWYPNLSFEGDIVPSLWNGTATGEDLRTSEALYKYVYRPYCQMCHNAQANAPKTFANFQSSAASIVNKTCGSLLFMPHSEVTFEAFWNSSARAHLVSALGVHDPCDGQ